MLEKVLSYFEQLAKIPHGSGNTKATSDYCVNFAKDHSLEYYQDDSNNVIIYKKASEGFENREPIMFQGHLDMVCEKEQGIDFDFLKDSLDLVIEDNYLSAKGTTLGGDDGIAVAMCLAILDSDVKHPALEVVFTTDEEIGMFGAQALDCSRLQSRRLLNIDSEEEGVLTVGCAGGARAELLLPLKPHYIPNNGNIDEDCFRVTVTGLIGGHSGAEIDKGRLNSNVVMGEFLLFLLDNDYHVRLIDVKGGNADNVIPSETVATIFATYEGDFFVAKDLQFLAQEFTLDTVVRTDPDLIVAVEPVNVPDDDNLTMMLGTVDSERIIEILSSAPNGIMAMSSDIPNMVETSLNLGRVFVDNEYMHAGFLVRSSVEAEKQKLLARLETLASNYGGKVVVDGVYPAWEYVRDSAFRDGVISVYRNLYKRDPQVLTIHAGLECGILQGKMPGLDAISIGPNILDIHSPSERLDLRSTERTINLVLKILETL